MKVALAFSSKNRLDLTKQTLPVPGEFDLFWNDGSTEATARDYFEAAPTASAKQRTRVTGGADAAIVFSLCQMLADSSYTHVGLLENDVLLDKDWFEPTMALFECGREDGLDVGAVSARAYEDRILVQRDGYALMHNLGAGHVIFTREAAQRVLENYRTGWWPDNRAIFSHLTGLDIGRWACFRAHNQWTTADWHFDAVLAQHGMASLALTPSRVDMLGQSPSLAEQGLKLATGAVEIFHNDEAFELYKLRSSMIRDGLWRPDIIRPVHRSSQANSYLYFPHQFPMPFWTGDWTLKWTNGFGPFTWEAAENAVTLGISLYGPVSFLVSGGDAPAKIKLVDTDTGFELAPELPALNAQQTVLSLAVPGGISNRQINLTCAKGVRLYGIQTSEPQAIVPHVFSYADLPRVE